MNANANEEQKAYRLGRLFADFLWLLYLRVRCTSLWQNSPPHGGYKTTIQEIATDRTVLVICQPGGAYLYGYVTVTLTGTPKKG